MKTLIFILTACALQANAQKAIIHFISANEIQTGVKSFGNLSDRYLFIDDKKACGLKRNGLYASFEVEPGEHSFQTSTGKGDPSGSFLVNIEAGKRYYFAFQASQAAWELTPSTGERIISGKSVSKVDCKEVDQ